MRVFESNLAAPVALPWALWIALQHVPRFSSLGTFFSGIKMGWESRGRGIISMIWSNLPRPSSGLCYLHYFLLSLSGVDVCTIYFAGYDGLLSVL